MQVHSKKIFQFLVQSNFKGKFMCDFKLYTQGLHIYDSYNPTESMRTHQFTSDNWSYALRNTLVATLLLVIIPCGDFCNCMHFSLVWLQTDTVRLMDYRDIQVNWISVVQGKHYKGASHLLRKLFPLVFTTEKLGSSYGQSKNIQSSYASAEEMGQLHLKSSKQDKPENLPKCYVYWDC